MKKYLVDVKVNVTIYNIEAKNQTEAKQQAEEIIQSKFGNIENQSKDLSVWQPKAIYVKLCK